MTLLCTVWAVVRLRPVALKESLGKTAKGSLGLRLFGRPPVGTPADAMEGNLRRIPAELPLDWPLVVCILVAVSFVPVVLIFYEYLDRYRSGARFGYQDDYLGMAMNIWLRSSLALRSPS